MKNVFAALAVVVILSTTCSSCKVAAPGFKTVQNVKFEHFGMKGLKLGADAVFHNPNHIKFKITDIDLNVVLDDKLIGTLGEKTDIPVTSKSDFTIALGFNLKPEGTILEDFKTLYNILVDKDSEIYIVGNIRVKALVFKFTVPVKYRQRMKRSDFK